MSFYTQYNVNEPSNLYIKKVWCLDNINNAVALEERSALPNGCQNIAIVQGQGVEIQTIQAKYKLDAGVYLTGQMTSRVKVLIKAHTKIILIQLYPWTLSNLTKEHGFVDQIKPIDPFFLGEPLSLNPDNVADAQTLVTHLNTHFELKTIDNQDTLVEQICQYVFSAKGECKVASILDMFEFSKRTIQTKFKQTTGLSIKQFIDIIKLRSAVNSVANNKREHANGADVAVEHQYFDQSHLVKSFNKKTGITPAKFDSKKFIMPPKNA